jgi:CRISPR/Cas system-associated endonuclease/helicase Cas3
MKVFHGSDTDVSVVDLQKCKPNKDFGRGFYVTKLRSQAEDMAKRVTKYSKLTPVVTEFEFDEYAYEDEDLKVLRFGDYSEEWLDFVVLNRNADKRRQAHDYDIIEGPVADDRISRNVSKYLRGKIAKEVFLEMLKHSENHQICFCTVNSLQMLEYVENPKDIEYEVSEIGEPLLEQFIVDFDIDEEAATDKFFSSKTFAKLADERSELYKKTWQEIYELLKQELNKESD